MENIIIGPVQEKWLQSLEQHPERQIDGRLGIKYDDGSYKACCLGEGGLIAGVCAWKDSELITIGTEARGSLMGCYENLGLRGAGGVPLNRGEFKPLTNLNDGYFDEAYPTNESSFVPAKTWPEIAAIIRANPEQYFEKSI